jgi:hypothetical protein
MIVTRTRTRRMSRSRSPANQPAPSAAGWLADRLTPRYRVCLDMV